jgi:hypothetical protein
MSGGSVRGSDRVMKSAVFEQARTGYLREFGRDSCSPSGDETRSQYVTRLRLEKLRDDLSEREQAIISTLAWVRVATAVQLEALHFADVSRRMARKQLASLVDRRVLRRLPRVVGGRRAGSTGYVYALDIAGQRLAGLASGVQIDRAWRIGTPFLAHSLAVTEVYVRLVLAERAGSLRLLRFVCEPASWRRFFGPGGARAALKPDAYVVVHVGDYEDHWFFEIDRGTEHPPTAARKCNLYRGYRRSGREQAKYGVFPRVLWLVPDKRRAEIIRGVIRRQPSKSAEMFDVELLGAVVERVLQGAAP